MRDYAKISTRIWNDAKFLSMSRNGQLGFFFLMTHPHQTAIGAMRTTIAGLAAELGWPGEAFEEAFGEAFAKGMVKSDQKACLIWLPNFLKYNAPESPNCVKAWKKGFDELPECELQRVIYQHIKDFAEGLTEAFAKAFHEAFPEAFAPPSPNPQPQPQPITIALTKEDKIGGGDGIPDELRGLVLYEQDKKLCDTWSDLYKAWIIAFPNLDVMEQIRQAHAWEVSHPNKRKTDRARYLNGWLSRSQNPQKQQEKLTDEEQRERNASHMTDEEEAHANAIGRGEDKVPCLPGEERTMLPEPEWHKEMMKKGAKTE